MAPPVNGVQARPAGPTAAAAPATTQATPEQLLLGAAGQLATQYFGGGQQQQGAPQQAAGQQGYGPMDEFAFLDTQFGLDYSQAIMDSTIGPQSYIGMLLGGIDLSQYNSENIGFMFEGLETDPNTPKNLEGSQLARGMGTGGVRPKGTEWASRPIETWLEKDG